MLGKSLNTGVNHVSLDLRKFNPSLKDLEKICHHFKIGKLLNYEVEKNISVSHTNFFVYVKTNQSEYALKFYPLDQSKLITIEYILNRLLINEHFNTPLLHASVKGLPFVKMDHHLVTCADYIDAPQIWQKMYVKKTIPLINASMKQLKNILALHKQRIDLPKNKDLTTTFNELIKDSYFLSLDANKTLIKRSLLNACHTYQKNQKLFTRQLIHNNTSLSNLLFDGNQIYTLDLSHIQHTYALSDLSGLIISCLFFNIPKPTIKKLTLDYFKQHQLNSSYKEVLRTLITIGLIKEYMKNCHRENSLDLSTYSVVVRKKFLKQIKSLKKSVCLMLAPKTLSDLM